MEIDAQNLVTAEDSTVTKSDTNLRQHFADLFDKFSPNSTARTELVEPPQIEGSTVDDWLRFFISNGFIFIVWLLAMVWVCYVIFYHSRVAGYVITKIVNYLFIKNGYFKVGSFSYASISGKIMFRDLVYVNEDYSIRVQDGWIVFFYWIPYVFRNAKTEDLSTSDARVSVFLNGFELHIYNQSKTYFDLEKLFNLPSKIFGDHDGDKEKELDLKKKADEERRKKIIKTMNESAAVNELKQSIWRDLFPFTKFEIASGRFVFGNQLMPSTLSISFEESHFSYTSRPAVSSYDLFTHILKGKAENLQVVLVPSPKYTGTMNDEPPRYMGDGFIVFRTNKIDFYYYQDEPGLMIEESMNEVDDTPPAWGMVIKCGKGTDFSYGPWADRQRDYLYSFFYPANYQMVSVSEKPKMGELRRFESFDVRLSTLHDAKIDILFSKNKETKALHINAGPGTYLELSVPWVCNETGYTTHILGQILHLDATTSLQFRPLISSETLEIDVKIYYPRIWNAHQDWNCKITACKATIDLIFAHKIFIQDLIEDWSDKNAPDILKFIPYTWRISLVIKEFELLVLANEHNWIDCSTGLNDENCKIAICGEHFDMAFDLPFIEFLPPKLAIKIWIQGECLEGAFYLPECSINRDIIELLQQYSTLMCRDGNRKNYLQNFGQSRKWKNVVSRENHWYECMTAPIVALSITYDFYPMPVIISTGIKDSEITTSELEEMILWPLRPERSGGPPYRPHATQSESIDFDPTTLQPDVMTVELEIGPMNLAIFGSLFMFLWNIKENYLGESQVFSEMSASFFDDKFEQNVKKRSETASSEKKEKNATEPENDQLQQQQQATKPFDPRLYRPFEVIVSVTLHEIQGHLVHCTNQSEVYAPLVYVEKLCFELQKGFSETLLQLIISPAVLQVEDTLQREYALNESWKEGFLTLSSLQFRGHAMFSNLDRPIESETLEYSWLVEVEVGEIGGRLTLDHLQQILIPLENFFFQILQADIGLQPPNPFKKCLHDQLQNECPQSDVFGNRLCPYSEDLKYRMVRVIVNQIDLFLLESNVALNVMVPNVKLATCNLHILNTIDGFTLLVTDVAVRQFVSLAQVEKSSSESHWLEISSIATGPLFVDAALSSSSVDNYAVSQIDFIKKHDASTKRLWFLWNDSYRPKCGCVGNASFLGCNLVGQNFFAFSSAAGKVEEIASHSKPLCFGGTLHNHIALFNPSYGESLLHPGNFLLDINSPLMVDTSNAISNTSKYTTGRSSRSTFSKENSPNTQRQSPRPNTLLSVNAASRDRLKGSISVETSFPSLRQQDSATRPSVTSSERFFSAEDLSLATMDPSNLKSSSSNRTDLDVQSLSRSYKTITNTDNELGSPSSDATWASPQGVLSAEDITSQSRYYTAVGGATLSSSQRHISANTSNATLPRFDSFSSDSSPTLVSPDSDFEKSKDDKTLDDRSLGIEKSSKSNKNNVATADRRSPSLTLSTNSFMSAISEHDDLDLVDLRNQLEKPIFESPLLMSTYSLYMSQYCAQHIDIPPPFPLLQNARIANYLGVKSSQVMHFERLLYEYRHEWKPKFSLRRAGFSETRIFSKKAADHEMMDEAKYYSTFFVPGIVAQRATIQRAKDSNFLTDNEVIFSQRKPTTVTFSETPRSRTGTSNVRDDNESIKNNRSETLIDPNILGTSLVREREETIDNIQVYVHFREIELKISPLTLDVITTFVTSIDQIMSRLHPGSVLNHLSLACQTHVQDKNLLKKEKLLYLGQLHMRAWKLLKQRQNMKHLNRSISFSERASKIVHEQGGHANMLVTNNLEIDRKVSIDVSVEIGRININSIQASLVEEIISFAALDRVRDLTCVSVLNLSFDNINFKFNRTFRRRKILHIVMEQSSVSNLSFTEKALMTRFFTRKPKKVYSEIETLADETTDAFIDEMQTNVTLNGIHLQLSRLVNSPDVLKDATLTVIPYSKSKVDFVYSGPLNAADDFCDSMKLQRRKIIKSVMQNQSSTSSASTTTTTTTTTSSLRKNFLKRQSCILSDAFGGADASPNEGNTASAPDATASSSKTGNSSDTEQQFSHFNRFIMFEAGLEKFVVNFSNSFSFNAIKLKLNADRSVSNNLTVESLTTPAISNELESIEIPNKPTGSSAVCGEIAKVWFHFASPPKMAINSYKSEFTRHDWHLLSSAVPLTIAWISAIDRMAFNYGSFERNTRQRLTSIVACLMSKTLNDYMQRKDAQLIKPLHSNSKQLTRIFSSMAKTFQEDPSIHIVNVLRANLKRSFKSNDEFEMFFTDASLVPKVHDLEKAIVVLLSQWKNLIHIPGSDRAPVTQSRKPSFSATKNPILALFEEKTKQLNLARQANTSANAAAHESILKMPANLQSGENSLPNFRVRGGDNESLILLASPQEAENETSKLLRGQPDCLSADSYIAATRDEVDANRVEVASNNTRHTASDIDAKRKRINNMPQRRTNRVQFMSRSHARVMYDQFLALPLVRNLSTVCHHAGSGITNSFNRLRRSTFATTAGRENHTPTVQTGYNESYNSLCSPDSPGDPAKNVGSPPNDITTAAAAAAAAVGRVRMVESTQIQQRLPAQRAAKIDEVRLNIPIDSYDPYDSTQINGRFSSYSNYGDKKDLYWWMVKQQDYMKNVANNFASTFRDYTKPSANAHYYNLDQDVVLDVTNLSAGADCTAVSSGDKSATLGDTSTMPILGKELNDDDEERIGTTKDGPFESAPRKADDESLPNKHILDGEVITAFDSFVKSLDLSKVYELDRVPNTDIDAIIGTKILLSLNVRQLCIDIDEAEVDIKKNIFTQSRLATLHFVVPNPLDSHLSAFVCDNLSAEAVVLMKVLPDADLIADYMKEFENNSKFIGISNSTAAIMQEFGKKIQQDESHLLLNSDSAIVIGFGVQLGHVIQRINLPLLRLVHQFSAMYENVVKTRFEMRSNRTTCHNDFDPKTNDGDDYSLNSMSSMSSSSSSSSSSEILSFGSITPTPAKQRRPTFPAIKEEKCVILIESPTIETNLMFEDAEFGKQSAENDEAEKPTFSLASNDQVQKCWQTVYYFLDQERRERLQLCLAHLANPHEPNLAEHWLNARSDTSPPIIVAGNGLIKRMNLVAMLSTLKLDGDLSNFSVNFSHHQCDRREKPKPNVAFTSMVHLKNSQTTAVEFCLAKTKISLFEDVPLSMPTEPSTSTATLHFQQQLVVDIAIGQSSLGLNHKNDTNREIVLAVEQLSNTLQQQQQQQKHRTINATQFAANEADMIRVRSTKSHDSNSARVLIGAIDIDIPQHPVALHGMMTRSGRQLSTTLQELRSSRQPSRLSRQQTMTQSNTGNVADSQFTPSSPLAAMANSSSLSSEFASSSHAVATGAPPTTPKVLSAKSIDGIANPLLKTKPPIGSKEHHHHQQQQQQQQHHHYATNIGRQGTTHPKFVQHHHHHHHHHQQQQEPEQSQLILPFAIDLTVILESFTIKASLLPSLRAQYRIGQVTGTGFTGSKAKFNIEVNHHSLCFNTKIEPCLNTDINLPTEASINLPGIHINAEYMEDNSNKKAITVGGGVGGPTLRSESFSDGGIVFRKGSYLNMIAEIGAFEHCLTTDLLNHLLFVQKVFMKEVNEVVQKMSRTDGASFIIIPDHHSADHRRHSSDFERDQANLDLLEQQLESQRTAISRVILFSLHLRMTGIQITATTPTNSAVRFETGAIELHLSNRVMNMSKRDLAMKVFVRVQLDFNLALGQLIRNAIFEEAEPDFQQLAYFKTRIGMRNTLQDEMIDRATAENDSVDENDDEDKELVLLTLTRPLLYVQPLALDKAVLVWINYRNAYEYWNEQRANLNSEVIQATQQVFDRVQPLTQSLSSSNSLGTLFLQLNVNDLGICLPVSSSVINFQNQMRIFDSDLKDALVLTLESTRISACSRGSLVSKAQFKNLCIRFADDFETNLDDWKPDLSDVSIKNLCIVSEGTYEICSRTITHQNHHFHAKAEGRKPNDEESIADAKWFLNVSWKMDGFDIHVDTSIGKHISALFKTMTAIAGDEDDDDDEDDEEDDMDEDEDDAEGEPIEDMIQSVKNNEDDACADIDKKAIDSKEELNFEGKPKILITSRSIDDSFHNRKKTRVPSEIDVKSPSRWSSIQTSDDSSSTKLLKKSRSHTARDIKEINKRRSRNIEKELNEQAKVINDLQQLGASNQTIQQEMQRYQELESAAFNHFKRGVIKRLKHSSKPGTSSKVMGIKDFAKTRAYSTSLYSYDETKFTTENAQTKATDDDLDHKAAETEAAVAGSSSSNQRISLSKIRSSTISIPHLKYDDNSSLVTLSSGDETSSYTENESASSPHSPAFSNNGDQSQPQVFDYTRSDNSNLLKSNFHQSLSVTPKKESSLANKTTTNVIDTNVSGQQPGIVASSSAAAALEPKIDFELDVKIFFNSGKCVLHTKDQQTKDAEMTINNRNFSSADMSANNTNNGATTIGPSTVSPTLSGKNNAQVPATQPPINKSRSSNKLSKFFGYGTNAYRREYHQPAGMNPDFTVFLIPGLDIKLHYSSKTISTSTEDEKDKEQAHFRNPIVPAQPERKATKEVTSPNNSLNRQKSTKKAFLFAWITLSSIPDEIFISPHILDFFEEALKPIPVTMSAPASNNATLSSMQSQQGAPMQGTSQSSSNDNLADAPVQYVYYASFPVDVMVFFHFQPTIIRLGCLPVSRVECLLHLPSIDLVMSSKRADLELGDSVDSPTTTPLTLQQLSSKTYKNMNKSLSSDSQTNNSCPTGGGLSITGCLADFSMYIFHPYGGQKNKVADRSLNIKQANSQPSYSDRKDSLSLQVEFVKINISRSRKIILGESLTQSISFSAICDIGTATFKYDVRRLNEILAFPRAWYRKAIWKKIFIGENTVNAIFSDDDDETDVVGDQRTTTNWKNSKEAFLANTSSSSSSSSTSSLSNEFSLDGSLSAKKDNRKPASKTTAKKRKMKPYMVAAVNNPWETLVLLTINFSNLNISMNMGNVMGNANWLTRNLMCDGSISIDSSGHRKFRFGIGLKNSMLDAKGGIVGGIVELSDIRTEINVREDRHREPQHRISCSLHTIENRIDYMGTSILMVRISDLSASFYDEWRVMAGQFETTATPHPSTSDVNQSDKCDDDNNDPPLQPQTPNSSFPTKRPASIYVHGCLKWDQMQVLMSKSTSPDFGKIISKLEEFFTQQFHSGKRVFDSLHPSTKAASASGQNINTLAHRDSFRSRQGKRTHSTGSSNSGNADSCSKIDAIAAEQIELTVSHHRHWQRALQFVTGLYRGNPLPVEQQYRSSVIAKHGIILGGTIEVRAQNISLACFYGINFRSKSWAVFSLKQPSITFMTEAQNIESEESGGGGGESENGNHNRAEIMSTHVVQNLSLHLGRHCSSGSDSPPPDMTSRTMATVCKISRNVAFPPQFRHLHEWFHYAFSPVEIDDVTRFPLPSPDNAEFDAYGVPIESLTSTASQLRANAATASADRRIKTTSEFNYKEEMIFAFPSMQLELKTEHLQGPAEPLPTERKPKVLCSFVSDFDDHIYVAVDAEAYFFLHDLINSYINESNTNRDAFAASKSTPKRTEAKNDGGGSKSAKSGEHKKGADSEASGGKDSKTVALTEKKKSEDDIGNDFRDFICKVWHLEPTVRLHSWASKNIDPYGVDYILQRLGFSQARTTIPKWIQRSTMDGIDKLISLFVYRMVLKNQEENPKTLLSKDVQSGQSTDA